MQTRLQGTFNKLSFNDAGMMTRSQKRLFDQMYSSSTRTIQEMKRVTSLKEKKSLFDNWSDWVSPSSFYDYFQDDEFMYVLRNNTVKGALHNNFSNSLFEDGKYFEKKVFEYYKEKFTPEEIVQITQKEGREEVRSKKLRKQTIEEMMKGTPIILQGILWNEELKCYGAADMIVRSDYLKKIVDEFFPDDDIGAKAPKLKGNYHYRVIDVKSKTLYIKKDDKLSNARPFRYPKAQLWFYNYEVSRIQGYNSNITYVLGKKSYTVNEGKKVHSPTFNYMFGEVDYRTETTNYDKEVRQCIQWIKDSKKYTMEKLFRLTPPLPRIELYPNMVGKFHEDKLKFARHIGEISSIYLCGKNDRNSAICRNIHSYKDINCTAENLGFKAGSSKHKKVSADLKLIQNNSLITPSKEEGLKTDFFHKGRTYLATMDFEFLKEFNYEELPVVKKRTVVYMIGFAYKDFLSNIDFSRVFTVEEISYKGEKKMLMEFVTFLNEVIKGRIEIMHWHHTENTQWKKLMLRHPDVEQALKLKKVNTFAEFYLPNLNSQGKKENEKEKEEDNEKKMKFTDMLQIFREEPIMVKDVHGFGLKPLIKHLVEYGIVKSESWENLDCLNGNDTISLIQQAREMSIQMDIPLNEIPITKQIEAYNRADCVVLIDLFEGIRNYYAN